MTTVVSPARPSVRRMLSIAPRDALTFLSDRVVLAVIFVVLFCLNYAPHLFDAFTNIVAVDIDLDHSRTISSAEFLGFAAIAVILRDLQADRVLRRGDFVAIAGIAVASLYPSPAVRAIAMTCLGLLFVARSDKRIASLGQLCIGIVWIDYWGPLVLDLIKPWLLPIEALFAFLPLWLFGSFSLDGTVIANGTGYAIQVFEPCSAFHNTITTAFIWLSLMKIMKMDFHLRQYCYLVLALAVVVLLNTARISILAISENQYLFWHMGAGLWIVKLTMLTTILGLFYLSVDTAQRPSEPAFLVT
jgi:hypothetical protein